MLRVLVWVIAFLALSASSAVAELKEGVRAPAFSAQASLGGKVFAFDLKRALAKGPVVLYFYPAAFTPGCTLEAHDFAAHMSAYKHLGASVIGVSEDPIATLQRFSVSECRSKFAVAADPDGHIARAYDAMLRTMPRAYANRTSYVIAPSGKIVYAYTDLNPVRHVTNTLDALARLHAK
jgi:peroxiredoxin Q/BCP